MKQNRTQKFLHLLGIFAIALLMASCSFGAPDYARLIEKDASIVARIDVKQIAEKASDVESDKMNEKIKTMLDGQGLSAQTLAKFKAIVDDPAEAGVDLRAPLLFYLTHVDEEQGALVGSLHNSNKFAELLKLVLQEQGGPELLTDGDLQIAQCDGMVIGFNDDMFYLLANTYDVNEAIPYIKGRFAAEKDSSIVARSDFKEMWDADGDMQMLISMNIINQYAGSADQEDIKKILPDNVSIADFSALLDLNFGKGEITLTSKNIAISDAAQDVLDKYSEALGTIDGKFLDYVPKDALFSMALNMEGAKCYEIIQSALAQSGGMDEKELNEVKQIMELVDGNVVLAIQKFDSHMQPDMLILAEVNDKEKALKLLKENLASGLQETASGQYKSDIGMYVGLSDDVFYISSHGAYDQLKEATDAVDAGDFKGNKAHAELSVKALDNIQSMFPFYAAFFMQFANPDLPLTPMLSTLDGCTRVQLSVEDEAQATLRVEFGEKDRNVLSNLVAAVDNM